jgi:hypothetical protein
MTIRSRFLLCLISVVVAGALAACGGSNSVTGATDGAASSPMTATIAGTILADAVGSPPAGTFSASSSSGGIRVSVSGTSLSTMTDDSGRFALSGVTPGETVELRFEGPGIDARLEVEGLVAGQTLTITVSVSGSTASRLTSSDEVEFKGFVDSVGGDHLVVDGRTVLVVAGTTELRGREDQPISLSEVPRGSFVEVEGWPQPDGTFIAREIELEDDDDDDDDDDEEEDDDDDDDEDDDDDDDDDDDS